MVSNPCRGGLGGSVERCFELCWWGVVAVAVEAVLVEPMHPGEGGELEFVDAWGILEWLAVSVAAFLALLVTAAVFAIRHWRRRAAARSPAS